MTEYVLENAASAEKHIELFRGCCADETFLKNRIVNLPGRCYNCKKQQ